METKMEIGKKRGSSPASNAGLIAQRVVLRLLVCALLASMFAVGALAPSADAQERPVRSQAQTTIQRGSQTGTVTGGVTNGTPSEIDLAVSEALASPDLLGVVGAADLRNTNGVAGIGGSVSGQVAAVVQATALPAQPEFARMFTGELDRLFVTRPTYNEPIVVTTKNVLVDRTISYELKAGACDNANNRRMLGELCFGINEVDAMPVEVAGNVAEIRALLKAAPGSRVVAPGVTAHQALAMADADLVELSLNSGPRTVRRLSTIPRDESGGLAPLDLPAITGAEAISTGMVATDQTAVAERFDFDTEYFLTGFTYYRHYGDIWEYEKDAWWHPRVYLAFSYAIDAGLGVRAPFSVDVDYVRGDNLEAELAVSVDPVSLDVAAPHVGLADGAYFDGNEFVFELNVDCRMVVEVGGWDKSIECDDVYSIDTNFSKDIDPVIGSETRTINNWWLWNDGDSPLRLEMFGGAVFGELNLGIEADVRNGRVGARISGHGAVAVSGVSNDITWFNTRSATAVTVANTDGTGRFGGGIEISDPQYAFGIGVSPQVRVTMGLDKYIERNWSFTVPLDFLSVSVGFSLDHHQGTVAHHDYTLFNGWAAEVATDPGHISDVVDGADNGGGQEPGPEVPVGQQGPVMEAPAAPVAEAPQLERPTEETPPILPPKLEQEAGQVGRVIGAG